MIGTIALVLYGAFVTYKNYQGKKLVQKLKREHIEIHNYYREKYDFYVNFKERYEDLLKERDKYLSKSKYNTEEITESVVEEVKPKRVRKAKSE